MSRPLSGRVPVAVDAAAHPRTIPEELVEAAAHGDQRSMAALLAAIRPIVVRYCRARLGRRDAAFGSADDIAQEVCFAVVRALPTYRHEGVAFIAFVYG